ncbi:MAG: Ca-activated chloride channel [Actinomycetota bacterium]|jgi:Ca-activated chloride channel family protein
MTFANPWLLASLLIVPLAVAGYRLAERGRMRYAVHYTNLDVLAAVAGGRPWRRLLPPAIFVLALATLCVALARPHVRTLVASDRATVVLVLDVSGSMRADDVKPSRLAAAQKAMHSFLDKVPKRLRVGLILFAGEPQVATPPTADHALVGQAIDDAGVYRGAGGTAIGDALKAAAELGVRSTGGSLDLVSTLGAARNLASRSAAKPARHASTLVSILFLSDGAQTRGSLRPLQGAAVAERAGIPVYTVALGTKRGGRIPGGFPGAGAFGGPPGGAGSGFFRRALRPDPAALRAIAKATGGQFYEARSAGAAEAAYAKLGSSLGRRPGRVEVSAEFAGGAAALLALALVLSALWAPRLP